MMFPHVYIILSGWLGVILWFVYRLSEINSKPIPKEKRKIPIAKPEKARENFAIKKGIKATKFSKKKKTMIKDGNADVVEDIEVLQDAGAFASAIAQVSRIGKGPKKKKPA